MNDLNNYKVIARKPDFQKPIMSISTMTLLIALLSAFVCNSIYAQVINDDVSTGKNLTLLLEHSLNYGMNFSARTIAKLIPRADGRYGLLFEDKNSVVGEEIAAMKALISSNELYTVQIRAEGQKHFVKASLPVCELLRSGFKEDIHVFLNKYGGLSGLSYSSPQMTIPQPCDATRLKDTVVFQTRIKLGEETPAPVLPVQIQGPRPLYLKDIRLGVEEEKKLQQVHQPFLFKYVSLHDHFIILASNFYFCMCLCSGMWC